MEKMVNKNSINISLLRIVAMLMVLSVHSGINSNWTKYTIAGQYGVTLFFTLSGYLILCSMEKKSCKEFYKKRILRIIPEYYTALIIYWLADFIKVFSEYNLSEINLTDVMGGIICVILLLRICYYRLIIGISGIIKMDGGQ